MPFERRPELQTRVQTIRAGTQLNSSSLPQVKRLMILHYLAASPGIHIGGAVPVIRCACALSQRSISGRDRPATSIEGVSRAVVLRREPLGLPPLCRAATDPLPGRARARGSRLPVPIYARILADKLSPTLGQPLIGAALATPPSRFEQLTN